MHDLPKGARQGLAFYRDGTITVYDETTTTAEELPHLGCRLGSGRRAQGRRQHRGGRLLGERLRRGADVNGDLAGQRRDPGRRGQRRYGGHPGTSSTQSGVHV